MGGHVWAVEQDLHVRKLEEKAGAYFKNGIYDLLLGQPDEKSCWIVSLWWTDQTSERDCRAHSVHW